MKMIVGLGNPGLEYQNTRHNMGFIVIDNFAKSLGVEIDKKKFNALYCDTFIEGEKVLLIKPLSYMNLSGEVIKSFINFFKINIEDILVIVDDLDTEAGTIKLRSKGSSASHNGLKDIEQNLKTNEYKRVKIGISNNKEKDPIDYVIGKISKKELDKINAVNSLAENLIDDFIVLDFDNVMNKYNQRR